MARKANTTRPRDQAIGEKLVDYVQDAHAMEKNVEAMLISMIVSSADGLMKEQMQAHLDQTREHSSRLEARLESMSEGGSLRKQVQAVVPSLLKAVVDQVRSDKPGKNARHVYVTEYLEIAAYELLERMAQHAGDTVTAAVARINRADEERMAEFIASNWDLVLELTLEEAV